MGLDGIRQVGKYINQSNRKAELALKRVTNHIPKKERSRDVMSLTEPFTMIVETERDFQRVTLDINFGNPPTLDCASNCIATTCESFNLNPGGHTVTVTNPYEAGTVKVFNNGVFLDTSQWYEENVAGQVYVQVQSSRDLLVICYSYVIC